jgi:hypothetical protein
VQLPAGDVAALVEQVIHRRLRRPPGGRRWNVGWPPPKPTWPI